jgi:hypothetical protein
MNGRDFDSGRLSRARLRAEPIGPTDYGEIELALVKFIGRLFEHARLDNEAIDNLPPEPSPAAEDMDGMGRHRIRSLWGKIAPRIYAGAIPLSITGEIDPDALPDYPSIVIACSSGVDMFEMGALDVQILAGVWDRSPERAGRLDVLNMVSAMRTAFFQFPDIGGGAVLARKDQGSPFSWRMIPAAWPHFFGLLTVTFQIGVPEPFTRNPFYNVPDP